MTTAQPKARTTAGFAPSPVEPLAHQLLATLAPHRMASTQQLHVLLRPDRSRQSVSERLNELLGKHLVDARPPALTDNHGDGRLAENSPHPHRPAHASGVRRRRTPARRRHGHLDRPPEVVFHAIGDGERVVADTVMHYTLIDDQQRRKLRAFVEVDRATMSSERLAAKLIEYARLWTYDPQPAGRCRNPTGQGWLRWYPVFPRVLSVLTGAGRQAMDNRVSDLKAMVAHHPLVADLAREVPLGAVMLEDLEEHGPTSDVWIPLAGGQPLPWTEL
ncbi:replication-relaxation family protein [Streptomyces sp. ME03-5684b]|uniref:replication-relaxation family protein n=1 Tax=Streptomyces sp. ME03-5684b TaxID=3028681 RepID=UPI0039F6FA3E